MSDITLDLMKALINESGSFMDMAPTHYLIISPKSLEKINVERKLPLLELEHDDQVGLDIIKVSEWMPDNEFYRIEITVPTPLNLRIDG